jgi:hypothetical protein
MIKVTKFMKAKMEGMVSINTSPLSNPFCIKMHKNSKAICSHCYSQRLEKFYGYKKGYVESWHNNGIELSTKKLESIPVLNYDYVRFHAHGEIINRRHYLNLVEIAKHNPNTMFALFTKRIDIVKNPIKVHNLIYIYSNPIINTVAKLPHGFDKVFNVQSVHDEKVNCPKKCIDCLVCYKHNDIEQIYEVMK